MQHSGNSLWDEIRLGVHFFVTGHQPGSLLLQWSVVVASRLANGDTTFIGTLRYHWLKGLQQSQITIWHGHQDCKKSPLGFIIMGNWECRLRPPIFDCFNAIPVLHCLLSWHHWQVRDTITAGFSFWLYWSNWYFITGLCNSMYFNCTHITSWTVSPSPTNK